MRPLTAADKVDSGLYVDWQLELGVDDVKVRLINAIARGRGQAVTHLFTGHRGVGKTTELYRVKHRLEKGVEGKRFFVSMLLAEEWLDLADMQPEDLIFQVVRQLVTDLEKAGFSVGAKKFGEFFRRLRDDFNTIVGLEAIEVGTNPLKFKFKLQDLSTERRQFRRLLQGQLPKVYDLVNREILDGAREWLVKNGHADDILIIVDEIDRIPLNLINDMGTNHENLFIGNSGKLRALDCGVLYTVPIELAYSRRQVSLWDIYGAEIRTLPVMPVLDRSGRVHDGHRVMRQIAERRVLAAGVDLGELFDPPELLNEVLSASGGHVRTLLVLLRSMLDRVERLPIRQLEVERGLRGVATDLARSLSGQDWELLDQVHRDKPRMNDNNNEDWNRLLRDSYVLAYYEEGTGFWYDRNPLLGYVDEQGSR
jgi:nucleoside-triphosphatase THEP1